MPVLRPMGKFQLGVRALVVEFAAEIQRSVFATSKDQASSRAVEELERRVRRSSPLSRHSQEGARSPVCPQPAEWPCRLCLGLEQLYRRPLLD